MSLFLLLSLLGHFLQGEGNSQAGTAAARATFVYLCQGSRSYAYHASARCEGLAWCTTRLRTVTLAEARRQDRYPCSRCNRKQQ